MKPYSTISRIAIGLIFGAAFGYCIGPYLSYLRVDSFVSLENYRHLVTYQNAKANYRASMILSMTLVFVVAGGGVSAAWKGMKVRHVIFGIAFVVSVLLISKYAATKIID